MREVSFTVDVMTWQGLIAYESSISIKRTATKREIQVAVGEHCKDKYKCYLSFEIFELPAPQGE